MSLWKRGITEIIGTFILVFVGCGAIVTNTVTEGAVSHLGISIAWGVVVMVVIYAIGDVSGAHLNPAVTLGFCMSGRMPWREASVYVPCEIIGAIAGAFLLRYLFPGQEDYGMTLPAVDLTRAFVFEVAMTAVLMFIILCVSTGSKEKGITAGIAVGAVVLMNSIFGGPMTGCSMNPARSIGPALASMQFANLWMYLVAPCIGAAIAVPTCRLIRCEEDCCPAPAITDLGVEKTDD